MAKKDTLRKLGIARSGTTAGTYKNAKDRPTELQMDSVYDAEKDLINSPKKPKDTKDSKKQDSKPNTDKTNNLSIVGLILAFFLPLIGLILSIIGLTQINKRGEKGKGIAIAGIVVSIFVGLAQLLFLLLIVFAVTNSKVDLTTYRDSAIGYSIKYPEGWSVTPQSVEGAKGVLIKKEVDNTGKVTGQVEAVYIAAPPNGYTKDVLQAISDSLKKDNKNTSVIFENTGTKDGLRTLTLITTYDGENGKVKSKTTVILKKDNSVFTISTQAPEENWNKYQDSFDEIHNTFQPN